MLTLSLFFEHPIYSKKPQLFLFPYMRNTNFRVALSSSLCALGTPTYGIPPPPSAWCWALPSEQTWTHYAQRSSGVPPLLVYWRAASTHDPRLELR